MKEIRGRSQDVPAREAAAYALGNDMSSEFDQAEVVRERRPAKMVTAVRMDMDVQAELEAVAEARGIGASTLMRQIIEEWVAAHREQPVPDQIGELVRHLEAAQRAAQALTHPAA